MRPADRTNLNNLPTELIERILRNLLCAREVKKAYPAPQAYLTHYDFSTAILRVNKALLAIGTPIFHQNNFILLSTNDEELLQHIANNLVPMWKSKAKLVSFKSYHLRLNILHRLTSRGEYVFALMLADDLQSLVNSMRMNYLTIDDQCDQHNWKYVLRFDLKPRHDGTRLPPAAQRALLEPFKKIRYREQRCVVRGEIDPTISAEFQAAMSSPSIFWRRADESAALYELVYWMQLRLDRLIQGKEWLAANLFNRNLETFIEACRTFCENIKHGDDAMMQSKFGAMVGRIVYHRVLIDLNLAVNCHSQEKTRALMRKALKDTLTNAAVALDYNPIVDLICATCHLALEEFDLCWARFDNIHARALDYEDKTMSLFVQEFERGLPKNHRQKRWRPSPDSLRCLVRGLTAVPHFSPLSGWSVVRTASAPTVADERYILRALSYTGDMLDHESQILSQPIAVDTKAADKIIAKYKKALAAAAAASGRKHNIDLGPRPFAFDPYSPFTLYRPGPGFEHFIDGQFRVSEHGLVLPMVDIPQSPPGW
jgi:hypothetical protein